MKRLFVEIANDPIKRECGLMDRKSMGKNNGMLFKFPYARKLSFWMKNTLIPLDMIFIDRNWTIVDINKNAMSCTECLTYDSKNPAMYVLEINGGLGDEFGMGIGDKVLLNEIK